MKSRGFFCIFLKKGGYRQVLCANSFTSLAELRLHRAEEPALDCPIAEGRVSVKGGEAACEAHHGVSVCSWIRKHHCQQFVEIRWRQLKEKKLRLSKSFAKKDIPSCRLALPVEKYFARKHRWQLSFILQPFCHNMILSTMPSEGLRMEQESGYQKFPIKAASSVCV